MAERPSFNEGTVEEGVYGIKSDVKTLQQLSSSGNAAKGKRQENHKEKAIGALGSAILEQFQGGGNQGSSGQGPSSEKI